MQTTASWGLSTASWYTWTPDGSLSWGEALFHSDGRKGDGLCGPSRYRSGSTAVISLSLNLEMFLPVPFLPTLQDP